MNLFAVCAVGVVAAVLSLVIRRHSEESALFVSLSSCALILLYLLHQLLSHFETIQSAIASAGVNADDLMILLKVVGLCLLTEFVCDTVSEAHMQALSTTISLAAKAAVIILALPLYCGLLNTVTQLMQL